jgi:iron complex outermembrane receptor protein
MVRANPSGWGDIGMNFIVRWIALGFPLAVSTALAGSAHAENIDDLRSMSIEDLANIDVSSVTRTAGSLRDAPAAIYVISHDDIARSGATSIPEILRLAPNLNVVRTSASNYIVTARGFSGNPTAQNFANKLLVLIDGRSVYTPLYSGVYWDMQDVLPQDIDRIEVISGPGATLWGANAVNGVINIITRGSGTTQGVLATAGAGDRTRNLAARYGGRIGSDISYRLYATAHQDRQSVTSTGAGADDRAHRIQGGFRFDWTPAATDTLALQGDAYGGAHAQGTAADENIKGRNLLGRWTRNWEGGAALQVQTYYDHTARLTENGGGNFKLDTLDLDIQHNFALGSHNAIVWGGGIRRSHYTINGAAGLAFVPPSRTLTLSNVFVQDSLTILPSLTAILGLKLEDDPYSGTTLLPSARVSWKVTPGALVWAAASRAIRSPTPFDRDVVESIGPTIFLTGSPSFRTEKLDTYELGLRLQPVSRVSLSISGFYNVYDDLRSIEPAPAGFLPLRWGNGLRGHTYGFDAWANYQLTGHWRVGAAYSLLRERFRFKPGASGLLGISQLGDDPKHRASLTSSMDIGHKITFDANLRYVSALPDPHVPAYAELGARIGWQVTPHINLAVSGDNLLHDRHQEFPAPQATAVPRSFFIEVLWRP